MLPRAAADRRAPEQATRRPPGKRRGLRRRALRSVSSVPSPVVLTVPLATMALPLCGAPALHPGAPEDPAAGLADETGGGNLRPGAEVGGILQQAVLAAAQRQHETGDRRVGNPGEAAAEAPLVGVDAAVKVDPDSHPAAAQRGDQVG